MVREVTATEAKAKLLSLLDEVEHGEEVVITRRGRTIARLTPARGSKPPMGMFKGIAWTVDPNDDLYSTGEEWELT
jgi:prevent-host-death family protein